MAEKIEITVTSNGTTESETKKAKELANQLNNAANAADLAARTAAKIEQATNTPRTRASRKKSSADDMLGEDTSVYRKQRGATGTGSAARDFSREAAGLGGLVRIYATFAANIYALSTAFNVLSRAADTSNMVKGLEQLGAASGKNLSGLAKQLVAASDGAISLKDAMAATATGSAGGLSGDQLVRLTNVAKTASQALGRDMPDALNRLTRGITKIEPELLDELGIMVKVDMANQNYARSLGKTVNSLTDLERRQAFANEAITQGEKKFKDIQMAANPYAKLSASIQNLSQSGLELVNKVLTPIVDVLASSPTGLSLAILGLSSVLFKQAIPDVKAWRDSLKDAERDAGKVAIDASNRAKALRDINTGEARKVLQQSIDDKKKEVEAFVLAEKVKRDQAIKAGLPEGKAFRAKVEENPDKVTDLLNLQIGAKKSAIVKANRDLLTIENEEARASKERAIAVNKAKVKSLEEAIRIQEGMVQGRLDREAVISNLEVERTRVTEARKISTLSQLAADRSALKARERQESLKILDIISETSKAEGFKAAISEASARTTASGLGKVAQATTMLKAGFIATADAAKGVYAAIAPWLPLLLIGFTALSYGIDKLSGNSKEVDKLDGSLDALQVSLKSVDSALDSISTKGPLAGLTVEAIQSRATAFTDLSIATKKVVKDLDSADKAATEFGKFIDQIKKMWGGDLRTKATDNVVKSLVDSIKVADGAIKDTLKSNLTAILGTSDLTAQGIEKALNSIDSPEKLKEKFFSLTRAQEQSSAATLKQSNALVNLRDKLSEVSKVAGDITTALLPTDNFSKYALGVTSIATSMGEVIQEAGGAYAAFLEITSKPGNLAAFSETAAIALLEEKANLDKLKTSLVEFTAIEDKRAKAQKANKDLKLSASIDGKLGTQKELTGSAKVEFDANMKYLEATKDNKAAMDKATDRLNKEAAESLRKGMLDAFDKGAELIQVALNLASREAALTISKAYASGLQGSGTADIMFKLKSEEIAIQKAQIEQELKLLVSQDAIQDKMESLATALNSNTLALNKSSIKTEAKEAGGMNADMSSRLKGLEDEQKLLDASKRKQEQISEILKKARESAKTGSATAYADALATEAAAARARANVTKSNEDAQIAVELQNRYQKVLGAVGKLRTKDAELAAASISTELAKVKEVEAKELKLLDVDKQKVDYRLSLNKLAQSTSPLFSKELANAQGILEAEKVKIALAQENAKLKAVESEFAIRQKGGENLSVQKAEAKMAIELNIAKIKAEAYIDEFNRLKSISDAKLAEQDREIAFRERMAVYSDNVSRASLDISLAELNAQQQLGTISAETAANVSYALAYQTEQLQKQQDLRQAEIEYNQKRAKSLEEFSNRDKVRTSPISTEELLAQSTELEKQTQEYNAQKASIEAKSNAVTTGLDLTRKTTLELEKQSKVLRLMDSIGNSLAKVFGKVGSAIGSVGKTIITSNKALVDIEARKQKEISVLRASGMQQEEAEAKTRVKYATESASVSIGAAADVAGAVASSFNEQSAAARAFHALEKAFHIAKLAMDIQAMFSTAAVAGSQAAAAGATATAWIPAVWARAFGEGGPYLGWALGAAAVAMIGKSVTGSKPSFRPSSDQLKETQGTGQTWDANGNKVSTGFGVLGDDSAKSESIVKSLEFIEKYTFEELEYSNQMLTALKNIDLGINGIARGVARTGGLLSGTAFGTLEGSSKGPLAGTLGNLIGGLASSIFGGGSTTNITGSGIKLGGTVGSIAAGSSQAMQYETGTTTTKGGWFSSDKTRAFTNTKAVQDEAFNKAIADSFQGISKTLIEAGTAIGLDSKQLASSIAQIPVDLSVETRGLKGSEISDAISAVLSNTADMLANKVLDIVKPFQQLNEGLAETAIRVARSSQVIDLQLKSVGMAFKAVGVESIQARMGLIELSGGLDQFISDSNFFKDNFLTEAERLAPIQKSVTDELSRLGYAGLNTREAFKDLVLSLDLTDKAQAELYTSLMKVQKGFAAVYKEADSTASKLEDAKAEQSSKVLSLLATKSQQLTIARNKELAALDPSLRAMQSWIYALEDEASAREDLIAAYDAEASARQNTIDKLKTSIDTLKAFSLSLALGENSPLTPEQKYATAKTAYEQLKTVLSSSTASTDDKVKALEELPNSITQLLETSKVFYASSEQYQKDYADAQATLALKIADSKAQLTIEERSLKELETQVGLLGKIDSSILSVVDALAKYNSAVGASNAAGAAAGMGTASSGAPSGSSSSSSSGQKDYLTTLLTGWYANHPYIKRAPDSEGLEYWKRDILSGKSLKEVKTSFTTAASEVTNKMPIISIDAFAKGGYMTGLSLVGEQGPELVNFSNPGQVYTNGQTGDIFGKFADAVAKEIASLKAEIARLTESNTHDAVLIANAVTNASNDNAQKVGESIKSSVGNNNWDSSRNLGVRL